MAKEKKNGTEFTKRIEGDVWTKALDEAFRKENNEVTIKGFRKGKAPKDVFLKNYGKESLYIPAAESLLQEAYESVLEESKIVPVVQPSVDIKSIDDTGVEFSFTIIPKPEVTIKKYKGLKVTKEAVIVSPEEIAHEMGHLLERYTELENKEDAIEEGDTVIIDFEGFKDGVAFDGGKGENYSLEIGSHIFIPGFEEQLIGMKPSEEKEIKVTFPEEYHAEDLKGKEGTFKVVVHEVKRPVTRELDALFFEDLGMEGVSDKESLEKELESSIHAQKEMDTEDQYIDRLLEEIAKNTEVDIPEEMVEEEVDRMMGRYEEQLKMQGLSLELFYQFTKSSEQDLRSQMEKGAFNHVLYRLILEEVMNLEKIEITEEDANKEAEEIAKKYQMEKDEFLQAFGGLDMIQYDLEMRKVMELLQEFNKA